MPNKETFETILSAIRQYDRIAIFRHIHPDFDALGSAFALKEFIHTNFLGKEILVLGDNHDDLTPRLYPKSSNAKNSWFMEQPFLAIILDTPNKRRVADPRYRNAELKIKIDHHPFVEQIGDIEYIDTDASSASEIIFDLIEKSKLSLTKETAEYLYTGIVGDTGRFEYSCSRKTFKAANKLLSAGIDLKTTYHKMYLRDINDLKVTTHILTHYNLTDNGFAYFVLTRKDLSDLNITTNQGKEFVNLFHFIDGIKVWAAITEDLKENCYRVSMRSEFIDIREFAAKWRGGGHPLAAGAKLYSEKEIETFVEDLNNLLISTSK